MGKIVDQSDDAMSFEEQLDQIDKTKVAKKNKAIKKVGRESKQTRDSSMVDQTNRKKKKSPSIFTKVAKKINLAKKDLNLDEKQSIFKSIVTTVNSDKKIHRKDRKKHRYLVKKQLRKEIDQRMPVKPIVPQTHEKIEQERVQVRKQKFLKEKAIEEFKSTMGTSFASIKQKLAQKSLFSQKK